MESYIVMRFVGETECKTVLISSQPSRCNLVPDFLTVGFSLLFNLHQRLISHCTIHNQVCLSKFVCDGGPGLLNLGPANSLRILAD